MVVKIISSKVVITDLRNALSEKLTTGPSDCARLLGWAGFALKKYYDSEVQIMKVRNKT